MGGGIGGLFSAAFADTEEEALKSGLAAGVLGGATGGATGALRAAWVRAASRSALSSAAAAAEGGTMNSSNALEGVERASERLVRAVSKRRTVDIARAGTEEMRYLDAIGAEANVGGPTMTHILLRPNPSKAAVLEEFLHGTQERLGIIRQLGASGMGSAETHVKNFMIRHSKLLGLSPEDVARLVKLRDMGL